MVRARIERDTAGTHRIFVQRAKYKHWFELGRHRGTDAAFGRAFNAGAIRWDGIIDNESLFRR